MRGRLSISALETSLAVPVTTLVGKNPGGIVAVEVDVAEHGGGTIVGLVI